MYTKLRTIIYNINACSLKNGRKVYFFVASNIEQSGHVFVLQESEIRTKGEGGETAKENKRFHELWQRLPAHHVDPVRCV